MGRFDSKWESLLIPPKQIPRIHLLLHVAQHIRIEAVGQQLLRVLGQVVAAVAEAGVVVVGADARVHAHAVDDLLRVEPLHLRIGVELVKVGDAHGQVGVANRHRAFDHHQHLGEGDPQHVLGGILHRGSVEELAHVVVVGGRGNDHQFGLPVSGVLVGGGGKVQRALASFCFREEALELVVLDGRDKVVQLFSFCRCGGDSCHLVMLRQQHGQ